MNQTSKEAMPQMDVGDNKQQIPSAVLPEKPSRLPRPADTGHSGIRDQRAHVRTSDTVAALQPKRLSRPVIHVSQVDGVGRSVELLRQYRKPFSTKIMSEQDLRMARSVAILRSGGLGDLLMLTASIRALKKEYDHLDIYLYVARHLVPIFDGNPYVHKAAPMEDYVEWAFDVELDVNHYVERSPLRNDVDRTSLFGKAFGLNIEDGSVDYFLRNDEVAWAKRWMEDRGIGDNRIGIAPFATDPRRTLEPDNVSDFIRDRVSEGWDCIVFDSGDAAEPLFGGLKGVHLAIGLKIRQVAAILSLCSALLSTDSGLYHLAAGVQKNGRPFIGVVFSVIAPELRMKWYKNSCAMIASEIECCPCGDDPTFTGRCGRECMKAMDAKRMAWPLMLMAPRSNPNENE